MPPKQQKLKNDYEFARLVYSVIRGETSFNEFRKQHKLYINAPTRIRAFFKIFDQDKLKEELTEKGFTGNYDEQPITILYPLLTKLNFVKIPIRKDSIGKTTLSCGRKRKI